MIFRRHGRHWRPCKPTKPQVTLVREDGQPNRHMASIELLEAREDNGKRIRHVLGTYDTPEEAYIAIEQAKDAYGIWMRENGLS